MNFDVDKIVSAMIAKECSDAGQMTLGALIAELNKHPRDKRIYFDFAYLVPGSLESYRGYYDHLAITFEERGDTTVGSLLERATDALGASFTGYKGGEFVMGKGAPLWASNYGRVSSQRIVGVRADDWAVIILTKNDYIA